MGNPPFELHLKLEKIQTWLFSIPRLRAMVGANALLASAEEQMRQKKLRSRKQRPSILTQPLILDVLAALGIASLEQALASLLADVRARALASWSQP